ncbi:MAG: alpha/beta fold hydrolase, partial [Acidiferrobacterales bacterium]
MCTEACGSGLTHYRISGHGKPVVLIHGVGLDLNMWEAQVAALADRFQVIRYDMLGHGSSATPIPATELGDFVDQLAELLDALGLDRVVLVGFSMGGLVARRFACLYPGRLERLVLMNTVFRRNPEQRRAVEERVQQVAADGPVATADVAIRRWFSTEFRERNVEDVETIRQRLITNDPQGYLAAYRIFGNAGDEAPEQLKAIRCPTLVLTGEYDVGSTPEMAEQLVACLPYAKVVVFPGLRHMAPIEGAQQVNAEL